VKIEACELTEKGLEVRHLIVHDEDEASVLISYSGLADGWRMEVNVMLHAEVLLRYNARNAALDHARCMNSPDVDPASVAILVGHAELNAAKAVHVDF
jgi:hypothetical protein